MLLFKRMGAAFLLTLIIFLGFLGFFVADCNSRQVAFGDTLEAIPRIDIEKSQDEWIFTAGGFTYRFSLPTHLKTTSDISSLFLSPDLATVWALFFDLE